MQRMMLVLKRGSEQEAALRKLIDEQQDRTAAGYRAWLTPEVFGARFGPSDSDIQTLTAWLRAHGFEVEPPSKGRIAIEFSGTARQVQEAFHTEIHQYNANGQHHWANATEPSIPSALAPAVYGILSLHNFPRHTQSTLLGAPQPGAASGAGPLPLFTFTPQQTTLYGVGPTDFATIYNLLPLWKAGIDGTGQTIAVVGESNINVADVRSFRSLFGLPANDPKIILNGPDPGLVGDEPEAVLDVTWTGAVAKNATIDFVVSASTETAFGVDLSALYIVDNNLAPVLSESYGDCEANLGNAGNAFFHALWQQAAAQGITVVIAAGDGGSAGCDNFNVQSAAFRGLAVSGFASTPYNVAVGGTDFDQSPSNALSYWSATNDAATGSSALSYIPETTWNDSCASYLPGSCFTGSNFLNILGGSGGPSSCSTLDSTGACSSGYSKPSWQTGAGVPLDGVRDTPDVSLFASNGFNGSFYIICEEDALLVPIPCSLTKYSFVGFGGTSVSTPAFAGIMALVNQKMAAQGLSARQGNANYALYKLASQPGASCDSSTAVSGNACIFYDITKGNNSVPCLAGSPNCGAALGNSFGVLTDPNDPTRVAWPATPGYDLATGLGSVNASNLVNQWSSVTFRPSTTVLNSVTPLSVAHGQPVTISATVTAQSGTGTPTGLVALMATPAGKTLGVDLFPLSAGTVNGTTALLPGGTYSVTAHYGGDEVFGGSDSAPLQVTVGKENSATSASVVSPLLAPSSSQTSVAYGSIFFLRGDVTNSSFRACAPDSQQTKVPCPTGTVSFSSNGKTLNTAGYALNSLGYTEDQSSYSAFTSLGSYALQAQYSGDNSFNPSSSSVNLTVTQAPTFLGLLAVPNPCCATNTVYSGQSFQVLASVFTESVLAAPSGAAHHTPGRSGAGRYHSDDASRRDQRWHSHRRVRLSGCAVDDFAGYPRHLHLHGKLLRRYQLSWRPRHASTRRNRGGYDIPHGLAHPCYDDCRGWTGRDHDDHLHGY